MQPLCQAIEKKVLQNVRLSKNDGLALMSSNNLVWLGYLANKSYNSSKDYVFFNVNRHINLTNICTAKCKFCAFGRDIDTLGAYALTKKQVLSIASIAAKDPELRELHIVSGLHPQWPFEYYVDVIRALKQSFPQLHLKAFTAVEICHFAKISGLPIKTVLETLKNAELNSMPGGGAEILSSRVRQILCPNKASSLEWLKISKTAHLLNIPTNASMLYGHIETAEELIDHLITLRSLQDETHGFQTFIILPFHPVNTTIKGYKRTSSWNDLKILAIARLMLDNFKYIKAYWVMLTIPIAQLALGYGANDLDGTVTEEKIAHSAGAETKQGLNKEALINLISQTGKIPVERDSIYNIIKIYDT